MKYNNHHFSLLLIYIYLYLRISHNNQITVPVSSSTTIHQKSTSSKSKLNPQEGISYSANLKKMKEDNNNNLHHQQLHQPSSSSSSSSPSGYGDKSMICQVCQSILSKPKTLKCDHSYCSDCLDLSLVDKNSIPGDSITYYCVQCRLKTPARDVRVDDSLYRALADYSSNKSLGSSSSPSPPPLNSSSSIAIAISNSSSSSFSGPSSSMGGNYYKLFNQQQQQGNSNGNSINSSTGISSSTPSYSPPLSTSPLLFSPVKEFNVLSSSTSTPALSSYLSPTPLSPKSPLFKSTEIPPSSSPLLTSTSSFPPSSAIHNQYNNNNNNHNNANANILSSPRNGNNNNNNNNNTINANANRNNNNKMIGGNGTLVPPLPSISTSNLLPNMYHQPPPQSPSSNFLNPLSLSSSLLEKSNNPLGGSHGSSITSSEGGGGFSRNASTGMSNSNSLLSELNQSYPSYLYSNSSNNPLNSSSSNPSNLSSSPLSASTPVYLSQSIQQQQFQQQYQQFQMYLQDHQQYQYKQHHQQQVQQQQQQQHPPLSPHHHQQQQPLSPHISVMNQHQQQHSLTPNSHHHSQHHSSSSTQTPTQHHHQSNNLKLPYLTPAIALKPADTRCIVHGQEYQYYCFDDQCQMSLCELCLHHHHNKHRIQSYGEIVAQNNVENQNMRDIFLRYKNYLEVESDIVESILKYNPVEDCKEQLRKEFERILSDLFNQVDSDFVNHRSRMEHKRERINKLLSDIEAERSRFFGHSSSPKSIHESNQQKAHFNDLFKAISEVSSTENNDIQWQFKFRNQLVSLPKNNNIVNNNNNVDSKQQTNNNNNNNFIKSINDNYQINLLKVSNLPFKCTLKFIYAIGGKGKQSVERYSINQNRWSYVAPMTNERNRISGIYDGRGHIYVFGGESGNISFTTVERYNIYNDTWENVAPLPSERSRHATIYDGKRYVYIIGGKDRWFTNHVDRFDLFTQEYQSLAPMKTQRSDLSAVYDGKNYIYAIGGFNGKALDIIERYDIAEDKWVRLLRMRKMRDGPGAIYDTRSDSIYLMGGSYGTKRISSCLDRYQVLTDPPRCDTMADMIKPIDVRNSVVYDNEDNVYVVGGYFSEVLSDAYRYNIQHNQWSTLRSMNEPREGNALVYVTIDIS
ncbi:RING zinc finger-containing protein [Cavenderia fasciculata]|uniref:RING zinc finger-containing protein n=1 Tax=Cavenderia fasciculata TaxID=261658 RepID=F4PPU1_CACFS|nr:RING zinc finger-containing protein [Cavenderia fasciculata]EGG22404.1 RING zinc finger-containing protein [Cavenderia fasciculata]|eukprot:XP_004360255.1 RING zinc finger-containing protein [Cavenderia fasciculata]